MKLSSVFVLSLASTAAAWQAKYPASGMVKKYTKPGLTRYSPVSNVPKEALVRSDGLGKQPVLGPPRTEDDKMLVQNYGGAQLATGYVRAKSRDHFCCNDNYAETAAPEGWKNQDSKMLYGSTPIRAAGVTNPSPAGYASQGMRTFAQQAKRDYFCCNDNYAESDPLVPKYQDGKMLGF